MIEEKIRKSDELINSSNIPLEIRNIVKCIIHGYIRETNGELPIEGIINVCKTEFIKIEEINESFRGVGKIFANTDTKIDEKCMVHHTLSYLNTKDIIKLITILTHEIGHVLTEYNPCQITQNKIYPIVKRTTTFYYNLYYKEDVLYAERQFGFRIADGFLETICTQIFMSDLFRTELKQYGYDKKDCEGKDRAGY